MNKILAYILVFSMLAYSATAANVYEAKSFTEHPEQIITLEERDAVKLNWDDKEHELMVRQIYLDKKKVDLTAFVEGAEVPYYVTITPKSSLQLDFDQDLEYDLKVSIFNLLKDEKIIALKLESLEKEPFQVITTKATIKSENKFYQNIPFNHFYILVGLFILSLGVWKRRALLKTYKNITKRQK